MDSISERLKKACEEYIDNYSIRYRCEPSNGSTINMEQQQPHQPSQSFELMQHEFLPLSFYKKDFELHKCFALFERNNKSEEVALSGLRTIGTVVFGHVLKQNERGILIKVLYIRTQQTEKGDEKQPYWDTVADKVDQYETCKVFCKTEDMGNIKNQININNNHEKTLVIAIVKHFNQNANRIEVSMINEDYEPMDLIEIISIPNDKSKTHKFKRPLGILSNEITSNKDNQEDSNMNNNNNNNTTSSSSSTTTIVQNIQKQSFFENPTLGSGQCFDFFKPASMYEDIGRNAMIHMKYPFQPEDYFDAVKPRQSRSWAEGRVQLGINIINKSGEYTEALEKFTQAITLDKSYPESHKRKLEAMRAINKREKRNVYSREAIEKAEKSYKHYAKLMEQQAGNVSSSSLKINKKRGHSDMMSKSPAPFDFNGGGGKNSNNKRVKK